MIDLVERVREGTGCEVAYAWFDTGLEYKATKEHLGYLEDRYGIEIMRHKARKSIPTCCRRYGQPFLSKYVSEQMGRLQKHGFRWEDEPRDVLMERYPNCTSAIKWWTNGWTRTPEPGWFDIGRNKLLKEFVVENPPDFPISSKCCWYAKKRVAQDIDAELGNDLMMVGTRKAEGGIRSAGSTCFSKHEGGVDTYRPLFWWNDDAKAEYIDLFDIRRSDCYEVWGFKRTGCVGCPFGRKVQDELAVAERFEPNLVRAARTIFADSYEYTRRYREYVADHEGQMRLSL